jgi:putative transposase
MVETVRYTYRLRPGAVAERALLDEWDRCRYLWNEAVHQERTGQRPTLCKLSKLLTKARGEFAWLRAGSREAQAQMLRNYTISLNRYYKVKRYGKPRVKKRKKARPSLQYTTRGFTIQERRLRLPGGLPIPVVWSRELPSKPTSVRVYRDSLGHWYAAFVVRRDVEPAPEVSGAIGIDWGVVTTATTTDAAYDLPFGGDRHRCAAELAQAHRKMSRRQPARGQGPSKGYQRAKRQAAKICKKAARQNAHAARAWVHRVVADHQVIAVEDFKPKFLAKSTMARKAADAAIGAAKRELIYRGERAGRKVVLVPPAYTTMTCSSCFAIAKQRLGYTADRDRNAARVILAMAEPNHAGVDDVRHCLPPPLEGVTVLSELGIPPL